MFSSGEYVSHGASDQVTLIKQWQRCAQVSSVLSLGLGLQQAEQCLAVSGLHRSAFRPITLVGTPPGLSASHC